MRLFPSELNLSFDETFEERLPDAYERLLMDIARGNQTLFMRSDEVLAAWDYIDPVIEICNAISIVVPGIPENATTNELIDICDGFIFTGGRPNVHPKFYGQKATKEHGEFDLGRDCLLYTSPSPRD